MKKIQKITAISLTFLTLICVSQFVMGLVPLTFSEEPVLTWGVAPEDEFTWDAGFDIDIEMDNSLWSYLSTIINTQMHQPPGSWVDTKAIFDAFKSMSKQYQIKAIVQNIFNTSSSLDAVNATYFLKMLKDNAFSKPTAFLKQLNDTWAQFVKDNFPTNIANTILENFPLDTNVTEYFYAICSNNLTAVQEEYGDLGFEDLLVALFSGYIDIGMPGENAWPVFIPKEINFLEDKEIALQYLNQLLINEFGIFFNLNYELEKLDVDQVWNQKSLILRINNLTKIMNYDIGRWTSSIKKSIQTKASPTYSKFTIADFLNETYYYMFFIQYGVTVDWWKIGGNAEFTIAYDNNGALTVAKTLIDTEIPTDMGQISVSANIYIERPGLVLPNIPLIVIGSVAAVAAVVGGIFYKKKKDAR